MIRLRDSDWERIRHHFPEEKISEGRPGRKPVPPRKILEATLWILNTGAQWHMLPQCYPNYKTVHRRSSYHGGKQVDVRPNRRYAIRARNRARHDNCGDR